MIKVPDPLPVVGGYTLDVYCDHENDDHEHSAFWPGRVDTFYGETKGECMRAARRRGWTIRRDHTATCPICSGKRR